MVKVSSLLFGVSTDFYNLENSCASFPASQKLISVTKKWTQTIATLSPIYGVSDMADKLLDVSGIEKNDSSRMAARKLVRELTDGNSAGKSDRIVDAYNKMNAGVIKKETLSMMNEQQITDAVVRCLSTKKRKNEQCSESKRETLTDEQTNFVNEVNKSISYENALSLATEELSKNFSRETETPVQKKNRQFLHSIYRLKSITKTNPWASIAPLSSLSKITKTTSNQKRGANIEVANKLQALEVRLSRLSSEYGSETRELSANGAESERSVSEAIKNMGASEFRSASGRSLSDPVPQVVVDLFGILAEIAFDRAKTKGFAILSARATQLVCVELTGKALRAEFAKEEDSLKSLWWLPNDNAPILPQTCATIRGLRVQEIATSGKSIYDALIADISILPLGLISRGAGLASSEILELDGLLPDDPKEIDKIQNDLVGIQRSKDGKEITKALAAIISRIGLIREKSLKFLFMEEHLNSVCELAFCKKMETPGSRECKKIIENGVRAIDKSDGLQIAKTRFIETMRIVLRNSDISLAKKNDLATMIGELEKSKGATNLSDLLTVNLELYKEMFLLAQKIGSSEASPEKMKEQLEKISQHGRRLAMLHRIEQRFAISPELDERLLFMAEPMLKALALSIKSVLANAESGSFGEREVQLAFLSFAKEFVRQSDHLLSLPGPQSVTVNNGQLDIDEQSLRDVVCPVRFALAVVSACQHRGGCDAAVVASYLQKPDRFLDDNNRCSPDQQQKWPEMAQFVSRALEVVKPTKATPPAVQLRNVSNLIFDVAERLLAQRKTRAFPLDKASLQAMRSIITGALGQDAQAVLIGFSGLIGRGLDVALHQRRDASLTDDDTVTDTMFGKALQKFSALAAAVASYAQNYSSGDDKLDEKQAKAQRDARKKAIESMMDVTTNRSAREGDMIVSLGINPGLSLIGYQTGPGTSGQSPFYYPQLSLPMGIALQGLPSAKLNRHLRRLGWHVQASFIDLAQFVSYDGSANLSMNNLRWSDFVMIGVQSGVLIGSNPNAQFVVGIDTRYAPTQSFLPKPADDSTTEPLRGVFRVGVFASYYVPFFDFN